MNIYHKTIPYIYKWIHIPTGKWYIGSKVRTGWNPSRHEEYICSSKEVKPLVMENRDDWEYHILHTGDAAYIVNLEKIILSELDARNDPMSYNQHNGDGLYNRYGVKENENTRLKKSAARLAEKNPMYGKRGDLSPHYGKSHSSCWRKNQSIGLKLYNENRPAEHNNNISKALKGNPKLSEKMIGENNPRYGKPALEHNKRASSIANSGNNNPMKKPEHQRTCEHCCKTVAKNHYTLFHGDKCRSKPATEIE